MSAATRLIYASFGLTTHDVRFLKVASSVFDAVLYLRCDGNNQSLLSSQIPNNVVCLDWFGTRHSILSVDPTKFLEPFNKIVEDFDPHLIHAGPLSSVAWVASTCSNVPVLGMSWATDVLVDAQNEWGASRVSETCSNIVGLIADSQTTATLARNFGFVGSNLFVFPWGVDLDIFTFSELPAIPPFRFASLRSHEPVYDVPTIIEGFAMTRAVAELRGPELTIVGQGSTSADCIKLANECELMDSIEWRAPFPEPELPALLEHHHGTISASRSDGSSVTMLQTMARGRIAIVTDLPSNLEWIEDGLNGFVFELGSSESLAQTLRRVITLGDGLVDVARNARRTVEHRADWRVNRQILVDAYSTFLQHNP